MAQHTMTEGRYENTACFFFKTKAFTHYCWTRIKTWITLGTGILFSRIFFKGKTKAFQKFIFLFWSSNPAKVWAICIWITLNASQIIFVYWILIEIRVNVWTVFSTPSLEQEISFLERKRRASYHFFPSKYSWNENVPLKWM